VKANRGAAGVDGQSISDFEADLSSNLYKPSVCSSIRAGNQSGSCMREMLYRTSWGKWRMTKPSFVIT
jgi:hypothetical protein